MPVDASDLFCRHCGGLSAEASGAERIECSNHPGQLAVAACIVCGKPVCGDCAVRSAGKFFCEDPEHCTIRNGWQPIYSCTSEFEADIVERNLQHAGLHIRVFSTGSHLELYWAHWKPIVRVWAARAKAAEAEALLRQLGLIGDADFSLPPSEDTFQ
jgi:hypothetical protein